MRPLRCWVVWARRLRDRVGLLPELRNWGGERVPVERPLHLMGVDVGGDGCVTCADVERVADLIDRPTCRNEDGFGKSFSCSACGYVAWTYDKSRCDPGDFSFCPNCGAEVVD